MFTIEDFKNGKCAVKNDGTLRELSEVLKLAFPNDPYHSESAFMFGRFYFQDKSCKLKWIYSYVTDLPQCRFESCPDY